MMYISKATITDRHNTTTIELKGYDYKRMAWALLQLMEMATLADKPATIVAVDTDAFSISFKGIDGITIMAYMREIERFDETVETMAENGIACQWEMSNW